MHLAVCVTARKLPLPARLPKCLRQVPSSRPPQQLEEPAQQRQQQQRRAPVAADKRAEKADKELMKQREKHPKENKKDKPSSPPVDLKRATKEFKSGGMRAEEFLPVLQVR